MILKKKEPPQILEKIVEKEPAISLQETPVKMVPIEESAIVQGTRHKKKEPKAIDIEKIVDISFLAEQIYQQIERRLKSERRRRGL